MSREPYVEYVGDEPPNCEQCGEEPASIKLSEVGLCYDCFTRTAGELLTPLLGYHPCGMLVWQNDGADESGSTQTAICLVPHGTEHRHRDRTAIPA